LHWSCTVRQNHTQVSIKLPYILRSIHFHYENNNYNQLYPTWTPFCIYGVDFQSLDRRRYFKFSSLNFPSQNRSKSRLNLSTIVVQKLFFVTRENVQLFCKIRSLKTVTMPRSFSGHCYLLPMIVTNLPDVVSVFG
jgi:hypothetical protein